jgi:hypothetical protein
MEYTELTRAFTIRSAGNLLCVIISKGRDRWALEARTAAGPSGCTPIANPARRWEACVHNLPTAGVAIETITGKHDGPFAGHHARYVLRCNVTEGGAA